MPQAAPRGRAHDTAIIRSSLKAAVLAHFDVDCDGFLNRVELRKFSEWHGFQGDDAQWETEYRLLCGDFHQDPVRGMSAAAFLTLVDDESDKGCYLADDEMSGLLDAAARRAASRRTNSACVLAVGMTPTPSPHPSGATRQLRGSSSR